MFDKIFNNKTSVVLLILFLFCFFDFTYLPAGLSLKDDRKLFFVLTFLLVLGIGSYKSQVTVFGKRLNYLFALLFIFAILNCISCYYFRHQAPWLTLYHWSPIFLIYLYYPLKALRLSVSSWEKILFSLIMLEMVVEIVTNLFPDLYLFNMTSSEEKFKNELRPRVYGNAILYISSLFCLNKALVSDERKAFYWMLYILSLLLIFLGGYRIVLFSILVSSFIMFYRTKVFGVKYFSVSLSFLFLFFFLVNSSLMDFRLKEIIERNEEQNFDNEDYVRLITLNYYLYDYFKSPIEMTLGSGMVKRSVKDDDFVQKYESNYSRQVSGNSIRYHIYPIDWGLLGFSWEGGIPATIILIVIALMLIFTNADKKFLYLSAWGIFVLLFSITNGRYYSHHNLIYTAILLVICDKLCTAKKLNSLLEK